MFVRRVMESVELVLEWLDSPERECESEAEESLTVSAEMNEPLSSLVGVGGIVEGSKVWPARGVARGVRDESSTVRES